MIPYRLLRLVWRWALVLATSAGPALAAHAGDCVLPPQRCAEDTLRAALASGYEKIELHIPPTASARTELRAGELARVRPVRWAGLPTRRMTVWLDVVSHAKAVRAIPMEFEVHAYVNGWRAATDLRPAATPVREDHLVRALLDVTALDTTPWCDAVGTMRLRKPLLAGQALTIAHLEPVTAVIRGQWVDVRAAKGDLLIDAQGQALQDGQVGDVIQIRVARAAAPVTGRVTASGVVEVVW